MANNETPIDIKQKVADAAEAMRQNGERNQLLGRIKLIELVAILSDDDTIEVPADIFEAFKTSEERRLVLLSFAAFAAQA